MAIDIRHPITFTPTQRASLARLVQNDTEAQQLWQSFKGIADQRLALEPQPLSVIHFEGMLHTHPSRIADTQCLLDMDHLVHWIDAYAASGDPCYAGRIRVFINAWVSAYIPTGNPINEAILLAIMTGYDLLMPDWSLAERTAIETWMRQIAALEMQSAVTRPQSTVNNWHTRRLSLTGLIGVILQDQALIDYTVHGYRTYVGVGLFPDGSSEDFHRRDALSYHQSGLKPLLVMARLLRRVGIELWDFEAGNGASAQRSLDFMLPYVDGTLVHAEWVNTQSRIDKDRAAAGIPFYLPGKPYDPTNALELFEIACYFDPRYLDIVRLLTGSSALRFPTWMTVICTPEENTFA